MPRSLRTQIELSADFGLVGSNVNRTIHKIEKSFSQSRKFSLTKRNQYITDEDYVIVYITESQFGRPKNK